MRVNKERTHDKYYDLKLVSASSLGWIEKSPLLFKKMLEQELQEESNNFFNYGDIVHKYVLEKNNWKILVADHTVPKSQQQKQFCEKFARARKGNKNDKLIKAYKESYAMKGNEKDEDVLTKANKLADTYKDYISYIKKEHVYDIYVTKEEMEHLNYIEESIRTHKLASQLIYNDEHDAFGDNDKLFIANEFEIHWTYPNGIECKSKIDRLIIDHENKIIKLVDLKTTSHLYDFVESAYYDYNYYRQLAFYWLALRWYLPKEMNIDFDGYRKETYIVAIGKKDPIEVRVFKIGEHSLSIGLEEIEELMAKIKWHTDNNEWEHTENYYHTEGYEKII